MPTDQQIRDRPDRPDRPETPRAGHAPGAAGGDGDNRNAEGKSRRWQMRQERLDKVRNANPKRRVRVTPAKESLRKILKHPGASTGSFRSTGSVEWPLDTFTRRRIRDGDVTVEERPQNEKENGNKPQERQARATRQETSTPGSGGPAA